jgi:CheY-like chemotaxis protein
MIEQATQRAAELTDKLQAYAGQGKYHETELDLDLIVKEVVQQFSLDLPPNVTLLCELADRLPYVRGDADQVAQVLTNMILNATEAFPTEAGGLVVIRTGSEAVDVARLGEGQWPLEVAPGRCATLEVADTGAGMSSEVAARAFEPFFSTKFTGRGLGLAAVKGMLGRHQGGLCVRSEPGRGSSLKIFLPVMTAPRPARGPEPLEPWRGTGSLLLIDEDEAGLTVARSLAERLGLKVLEARDAEEACALFRQCHAEMLLVILGANVLRKNGQAALRTMRKLNERVPVVVSLDHDEPGEGMLPGSLAGTIKKPIRMAELQGLLKRAAPHAPGDGAITA